MSPELKTLLYALTNENERQARILLTPTFESANDIWQLQLDILRFQLGVQKAINNRDVRKKELRSKERKLVARAARNWKSKVAAIHTQLTVEDDYIAVYQHAFRMSKLVGDAFASIMFRGKDQAIHPLTENSRLPGVPTDHGLQGVIAAAKMLFVSGAGFPVIHDMTNILRIGDISLTQLDGDPITLEIKTKLNGRQGDTLDLTVSVSGPMDPGRWEDIDAKIKERFQRDDNTESEPELKPRPRSSFRVDTRMRRQLDRMARAREHQSAVPGNLLRHGDMVTAVVRVDMGEQKHHWDKLQSAIRAARQSGYSSIVVDGTALYAVVYREDPIVLPSPEPFDTSLIERLPHDLVESGIFFTEDTSRNALIVTSLSEHLEGQVPVTAVPMLLLGIDLEDRVDLMWGRLLIFVMINPGKVAAALNDAGIDSKFPERPRDLPRSGLEMKVGFELADGSAWIAELGGMRRYFDRLLFDFITLDVYIQFIRAVADALPTILDEETQRIPPTEADKGTAELSSPNI